MGNALLYNSLNYTAYTRLITTEQTVPCCGGDMHLNLRDISTHIKLKDKLLLHFIAQSCTGLNAKHQGDRC
jgi:hypothetical protein